MQKLIVNAILELKKNAATDESFEKDLNGLIAVYTESLVTSVNNKILSVVFNSEIPKEIKEIVNQICLKRSDPLGHLLNKSSLDKMVSYLGKVIFERSQENWDAQTDVIKNHYEQIARKHILELSPLMLEYGLEKNKKMMDAVYKSIGQINHEMLFDDEVEELRHRIMMDIHNIMLEN